VKIEIGENLMRSWLRHVRGCQMAELNWKPSSSWKKFDDGQALMDQARVYFKDSRHIDVFKNTKNSFQLLRQAEIDVLGIKTDSTGKIEELYAVDIAYHEAGLNYSDTVERILKKLLRGRMAIQTYFGPMRCHVVFASPKVGGTVFHLIEQAVDELEIFFSQAEMETKIMLCANESFEREILTPTLRSSADTADSSELFLRSYRLLTNFRSVEPSELGERRAGRSATRTRLARSHTPSARPMPRAEDGPVSLGIITRWAGKRDSNVHRIIAIARKRCPVSREWLVDEIGRLGVSNNPSGAIASLMTNSGNAYGRLFVEQAGLLHFHPAVEQFVGKYDWAHP